MTDMTFANATNISSLGTKDSGLVSIMGTTFLCADDQVLFCHILHPSRIPY